MTSGKRTLFIFLIILLCICADQLTKQIVRTDLPKTRPIVLVKGVLKLDYTDNRGGVFIFELLLPPKWRGATVTAATALLLALSVLVLMISGRLHFLCGGSLSNLIDRIVLGRVIDFVNFSVPGLQPYIFNLADVAIVAGLALAMVGVVIHVARIELH
jgi:signal peptidase II